MKDANTPASALERLCWTAVLIMGASLPHWLHVPPWIPLLLATCVGWRFAGALAGWPLPGRLLRLVLALVAFSAVIAQFGTINGVTAGSALLTVMVALKFLEVHTQRDHLVLMIVAYFLAFASLLYQTSLLAGVYLIAFVWVATIGLLQLGRSGPLLGTWPTAKLAGRLLLKALPVMLILFVLFPRLPGPLWAIPGDTSSGATGLSDSMSPGDITELGLSDEVAFRVEFFDGPPLQEDMYWRGPVLAEFNGRTWTRDGRRRERVLETIEHLGQRSEYRVTLEPGSERRAFAIDMPESWDGGQHTIAMTGDYQLRVVRPESRSSRVAYDATSYARYRALEPLTPRERERLSRLPEGYNPRTHALVDEWLAAGLSRAEIIQRALGMFREETFYYTLTPPSLGRHTADEFLFETREGFCEHYASAFTIMMRAAGIPARVVTGYQGGWLNAFGGYYIVRQSDAHAWTEVWLEDDGWVRVDPTAAVAAERISLGAGGSSAAGGADRRGGLPAGFTRDLVLAWDVVNMYWDRWVLGYGPNLQRALLELLGFERPRAGQLVMLAVVAIAAFVVLSSLATVLASRPRRARDAAARAFERFVAKLRRAKVPPRAPTEAPTAYAERARRALPGAAADIDAIVGAYLHARYEPDVGDDDVRRLEEAVRAFRPT